MHMDSLKETDLTELSELEKSYNALARDGFKFYSELKKDVSKWIMESELLKQIGYTREDAQALIDQIIYKKVELIGEDQFATASGEKAPGVVLAIDFPDEVYDLARQAASLNIKDSLLDFLRMIEESDVHVTEVPDGKA